MNCNSFVESQIPISSIQSAVELKHSHANKPLLDSLISNGSPIQFLAADGKYHEVQLGFSVDSFLIQYDQTEGNVIAVKGDDGKLYMKSTNTFAEGLGDEVVGSIELEKASNKQLNISIADVNVKTGEISDNEIRYLTVGQGLTLDFSNGIISIDINQLEAPFNSHMEKQVSAGAGTVGVFDAGGQIVSGGLKLDALSTKKDLSTHADNTNLHVTAEKQATWNAKQNALTSQQLTAVNSGITAAKIATYDSYATSKLGVGGHLPGKNVVTDENGNISTEDKFDPSTKINVVAGAVQNDVVVFGNDGSLKDSGTKLGKFNSNETVRDYIDSSIAGAVVGSSYQGTFTYFGTKALVEAVEAPAKGSTAVVYIGDISSFTSLERGDYDGESWNFEEVRPLPTNGMWFEVDAMLTADPVSPGRLIVRMDGINPPSLDVRPSSGVYTDNVTIALNSQSAVGFKMHTLESGKSVLNATTADNIAYEFVDEDGVDSTKTLKEIIDESNANHEQKFEKNTAFNRNFDTSHQSATSTEVIGNNDTRLSDARPASDVYEWAKAAEKPSYTPAEVGALAADGTAVSANKLATARSIRVQLDSNDAVDFDGTKDITPGVWGTLPVANGGTGNSTLPEGQVLIGNGTSAVSFREISNSPEALSQKLFTAGGAYDLAASKQNKIQVSSSTPVGIEEGDLWFQLNGTEVTIKNYTGTAWATLYPKVDPVWKAQVDAAIASGGTPYVCSIGVTNDAVVSGMPSWAWSGDAGDYSVTIPYSAHGKGRMSFGGVFKCFPRVVTWTGDSSNGEITYDSPSINFDTGSVTVKSNTNDLLFVMIY